MIFEFTSKKWEGVAYFEQGQQHPLDEIQWTAQELQKKKHGTNEPDFPLCL